MNYERLTSTADGYYIISNNLIGALSLMSGEELIMFQLYNSKTQDRLINFLSQMNYNQNEIYEKINLLEKKLVHDGWKRTILPENWSSKLQAVYLNLTSNCNYMCVYCYEGTGKKIKNQEHPFIKLENLKIILRKIQAFNQDCEIIISGGEPFLHPDIFDILKCVEEQNFNFTILTNGSLITDKCTIQLSKLKKLKNLQISIDGITEATHKMTRGNTFYLTMTGINNVIKYKLPFSLAPTIHNENLDEIYELARFAFLNKGGFSPNNLRKFPHCPSIGFQLDGDKLLKLLNDVEQKTIKEFGIGVLGKHYKQSIIPMQFNRNNFVCGTGNLFVCIDWNGDVYPCHLLKTEKLKLGNLVTDSFDEIFQKADDLGIRKMSYEIHKCKNCHFMTTCGGGCKAGAFYAYGTFNREDCLCETLYKNQLNNLLRGIL